MTDEMVPGRRRSIGMNHHPKKIYLDLGNDPVNNLESFRIIQDLTQELTEQDIRDTFNNKLAKDPRIASSSSHCAPSMVSAQHYLRSR
jgi:hypothetical protein